MINFLLSLSTVQIAACGLVLILVITVMLLVMNDPRRRYK